jgi:Fic family protein
MKIPPFYIITPETLDLLAKIDVNRILISSQKIPDSQKERMKHLATLKSSLYSARIEGSQLTLAQAQNSARGENKKDLFNLLDTVNFIEKTIKTGSVIKIKTILEIHQRVMKNLGTTGSLRHEPGAIFNSAGVAIYLCPPASEIKNLLKQILRYVNSDTERFPLVAAMIAHLVFEKIHPFLDGNGRVGRLLVYAVLKSRNYDFGIHIPFEEYLDNHKNDYYYFLDTGLKDTNEYLVFMLKAFLDETEVIKNEMENLTKAPTDLYLSPRQEELFNLIKDHSLIPFDSIQRRFMAVPGRTLRYDLKKLADKNIIIKTAKTRGAYYKIK